MLGINPATLCNLVEREEIDTGARSGVTSEASDQLKALRRENAELRRANEILKTASAFFVQAELDRRLK
jgi:transposase-like protein